LLYLNCGAASSKNLFSCRAQRMSSSHRRGFVSAAWRGAAQAWRHGVTLWAAAAWRRQHPPQHGGAPGMAPHPYALFSAAP